MIAIRIAIGTMVYHFRRPLLSIALVAASSSVTAFEVNGMTSGMAAEEALNLLSSRSDKVTKIEGTGGVESTYVGVSNATNLTESITICKGRLHAYQQDIAGGFRAFVRTTQTEQMTAGPGTAFATARDTRVGEWSLIRFTWRYPAWLKEIAYSFITSDQTYIRYATAVQGCQL